MLIYCYQVFSFQVNIVSGEAKQEFSAKTDMSWKDFQKHVLECLDNPQAMQLTCKVSGDTGKALYLKVEDDFITAMERLCQQAWHARTHAVTLEIKNIIHFRLLRNESKIDSYDMLVGKSCKTTYCQVEKEISGEGYPTGS